MDYKDREALIFPDKVKNNQKWELTLTSKNGFFKKESGREIDVYDDIRSKYFNSDARGLGTISSFEKNTKRAVSQRTEFRSGSAYTNNQVNHTMSENPYSGRVQTATAKNN